MSEIHKSADIPDEVKNELVEGKPRVVTENIPQNLLDDVEKENKKIEQLANQYYNASRQFFKLEKMVKDMATKITDAEEARKKIYEYAYNKMKLGKRKEYRWQLKGNSFVGILNMLPKPQEEVK
jgi:hypothetical protein